MTAAESRLSSVKSRMGALELTNTAEDLMGALQNVKVTAAGLLGAMEVLTPQGLMSLEGSCEVFDSNESDETLEEVEPTRQDQGQCEERALYNI